MELEEMKSAWQSMSLELDKQKQMNLDLIKEMTQSKSKSHLHKLINYERMGQAVIYVTALLIILNFDKISGWLNITSTAIVMSLFAYAIYISESFIRKAKKIDIINSSVQQVHEDFKACQKAFVRLKRDGVITGFVLLIFFIPIVSLLMNGKDVTKDLHEYTVTLLTSFALMPIIVYGIYKIYKRNMSAVEKLMDDLKEPREDQ